MTAMTEGARVKCHICGRMPFPVEWGFPPELECHDLTKIGDLWCCPEHRVAKKRSRKSDLDRLADLFDEARRINEDSALFAVFSRVDVLIDQMRKKSKSPTKTKGSPDHGQNFSLQTAEAGGDPPTQ
jgi:hypothetical protein